MANPKLSVIPSREELSTAGNALIALLTGNKKLKQKGPNHLMIMIGEKPMPMPPAMPMMRKK